MPGKQLVVRKPPVYVPWKRGEAVFVALCMLGFWAGFAVAAMHATWAWGVFAAVVVFNLWQIAREVRKARRYATRQ